MPGFVLTGRAHAPVEEVWKLLFDPTRFPEWWAGVETVEQARRASTRSGPTATRTSRCRNGCAPTARAGRVAVSCQVSDIDFTWQLGRGRRRHDDHRHGRPAGARGPPTRRQRELIAASLTALAGWRRRGGRSVRPSDQQLLHELDDLRVVLTDLSARTGRGSAPPLSQTPDTSAARNASASSTRQAGEQRGDLPQPARHRPVVVPELAR